jgi:DNA polymerase delta subunit 1
MKRTNNASSSAGNKYNSNNNNNNNNNNVSKKLKSSDNNYEDDYSPSFEDELGMMDDCIMMTTDTDNFITGIDENDLSSSSNLSDNQQQLRWLRNVKKTYDSKIDNLAFHWLDIDMTSGDPLTSNPDGSNSIVGSMEGPVPIIRIYGVTAEGHSVMTNIHGFTPYFYISFPSSIDLTESFMAQLRQTLDHKVTLFLMLYIHT